MTNQNIKHYEHNSTEVLCLHEVCNAALVASPTHTQKA